MWLANTTVACVLYRVCVCARVLCEYDDDTGSEKQDRREKRRVENRLNAQRFPLLLFPIVHRMCVCVRLKYTGPSRKFMLLKSWF